MSGNESELGQFLELRLSEITLPEAAMVDGVASDRFVISRLNTSILSKFGEWLGDYTDLLPPKEAVLEMLGTAIDSALVALSAKHPVLIRLAGSTVKAAILRAASALYDSILNPEPEFQV